MRLIVCGGRDFADQDLVWNTLDAAVQYGGCTEIIVGYDPDNHAYQGADQLAWAWAVERDFPRRPFPAEWKRLGRSAGPIRNSRMAAQRPDECIAFPRANGEWGNGTLDMLRKAEAAGAKCYRVTPLEAPPSSDRAGHGTATTPGNSGTPSFIPNQEA